MKKKIELKNVNIKGLELFKTKEIQFDTSSMNLGKRKMKKKGWRIKLDNEIDKSSIWSNRCQE